MCTQFIGVWAAWTLFPLIFYIMSILFNSSGTILIGHFQSCYLPQTHKFLQPTHFTYNSLIPLARAHTREAHANIHTNMCSICTVKKQATHTIMVCVAYIVDSYMHMTHMTAHTHWHTHTHDAAPRKNKTRRSLTGFSGSCRGDGGMKVEEEGGLLIQAHPSLPSFADATVTIISLRKKKKKKRSAADAPRFRSLLLPLHQITITSIPPSVLALRLHVFLCSPRCCCRPDPLLFLLPSQSFSNYHSSASDSRGIRCWSPLFVRVSVWTDEALVNVTDEVFVSSNPRLCCCRKRRRKEGEVLCPERLLGWMDGWMEEVETVEREKGGRKSMCRWEGKCAPSNSDTCRKHISCKRGFTARPESLHRYHRGC